ncbi:MAG: hypothetical protein HRT45_14360 [Bdellovibrionales bacterium]|nr:hypothetical protein [Bdellovibrionales bacterium]
MMNFKGLALILILLFCFSSYAKKPKVLILYASGGHATAAKAIEQSLRASYEDKFEIVAHDYSAELTGFSHWFYVTGYDMVTTNAPSVMKVANLTNFFHYEHFPSFFTEVPFFGAVNQPDRIRRYLEAESPDVIVATHFGMAMTLGYLREMGHFSDVPVSWVHLDMLSNFFFYQVADYLDQVFLPNQQMVDEWSGYIDRDKLTASGVPIMPAMIEREEITEFESESANQLDPSLPTIMLMGGSMGALSYDSIIGQIGYQYRSRGQVQVVAVCGRNERAKHHLEAWRDRGDNDNFPKHVKLVTTGYIGTSELMELQAAADVIVSKPGGLSSFELLTTGKPTILTEGIGIQENKNAEHMAEQGAALYLPEVHMVGRAVRLVLENDESVSSLVPSAQKVAQDFRVERILDWVNNAKVLQPQRPEQPVLQRAFSRQEKVQRWWLSLIAPPVKQCQIMLSKFRKMRDRRRTQRAQ